MYLILTNAVCHENQTYIETNIIKFYSTKRLQLF